MTLARAHEDDRVVAGRGSSHRRQMCIESKHRGALHRVLASQRRVHVQTAEILADRLQLLQSKRETGS